MILINDYSNGNDMVVAAPGVDSVADLKGKKIGVEIGFVGHLLLLDALKQQGMTEGTATDLDQQFAQVLRLPPARCQRVAGCERRPEAASNAYGGIARRRTRRIG